MKLSKEWQQQAGVYQRAVDAVRAVDYDTKLSDADYGALVDARERAYLALVAASRRDESGPCVHRNSHAVDIDGIGERLRFCQDCGENFEQVTP